MARANIVFYSMYGHVWRMAEAVAEGAGQVSGTEVGIYQVPELIDEKTLEKSGAAASRKAFEHIPPAAPDVLAAADAIIFGTSTRFGNMCAQILT